MAMSENVIPFEPKKEEPAAAAPQESNPAGAPPPAFLANFTKEGILEMRIDLKVAVADHDKFHMLRGFIDNTRDQAMAMILDQRQKLEEKRQQIIQIQNQNGNGFRKSFVDKLLKH
jgi:hypothetical protein